MRMGESVWWTKTAFKSRCGMESHVGALQEHIARFPQRLWRASNRLQIALCGRASNALRLVRVFEAPVTSIYLFRKCSKANVRRCTKSAPLQQQEIEKLRRVRSTQSQRVSCIGQGESVS